MALLTFERFRKSTKAFRKVAGNENKFWKIDDALLKLDDADDHEKRLMALEALELALARKRDPGHIQAKPHKYGAMSAAEINSVEELGNEVDKALEAASKSCVDVEIARQVCQQLTDVRIADVDFSPAVTQAAKAKILDDGRSLYDTVKSEFDVAGAGPVPAKVDGKWPAVAGHTTSYAQVAHAELQPRQSKLFVDHDKALVNAKRTAVEGIGIHIAGLNQISMNVLDCRYAVCESITATVISRCKANGFQGRLEWVGIWYGDKRGHSIVIAHREGTLRDPTTWGDHWFVVDMWFHNLGMRNQFLWASDKDRDEYLEKEIKPHLATNGGPKIMSVA